MVINKTPKKERRSKIKGVQDRRVFGGWRGSLADGKKESGGRRKGVKVKKKQVLRRTLGEGTRE